MQVKKKLEVKKNLAARESLNGEKIAQAVECRKEEENDQQRRKQKMYPV